MGDKWSFTVLGFSSSQRDLDVLHPIFLFRFHDITTDLSKESMNSGGTIGTNLVKWRAIKKHRKSSEM
jgi:hypothetical protein